MGPEERVVEAHRRRSQAGTLLGIGHVTLLPMGLVSILLATLVLRQNGGQGER